MVLMFGIQERFFTARVENGGSSQNIKVVIEPSVKLKQHSVYCCKENVNFQGFAWATCSRTICPIDDDKECVQLGIG